MENYFVENGYQRSYGAKVWKGYHEADWHDSKGTKIKNWKQKSVHVWFKDEYKTASFNNQSQNQDISDLEKMDMGLEILKKYGHGKAFNNLCKKLKISDDDKKRVLSKYKREK